jgi:hypothetical protein
MTVKHQPVRRPTQRNAVDRAPHLHVSYPLYSYCRRAPHPCSLIRQRQGVGSRTSELQGGRGPLWSTPRRKGRHLRSRAPPAIACWSTTALLGTGHSSDRRSSSQSLLKDVVVRVRPGRNHRFVGTSAC